MSEKKNYPQPKPVPPPPPPPPMDTVKTDVPRDKIITSSSKPPKAK